MEFVEFLLGCECGIFVEFVLVVGLGMQGSSKVAYSFFLVATGQLHGFFFLPRNRLSLVASFT